MEGILMNKGLCVTFIICGVCLAVFGTTMFVSFIQFKFFTIPLIPTLDKVVVFIIAVSGLALLTYGIITLKKLNPKINV